jgi:beta-galactosidase
MPFDEKVDYMTVLNQLYRTLYSLRVEVDFVCPQSPNLSAYRLIVVPPLYIASDELLVRLAEYVRDGGHLLACFKSGFGNENSTVRWAMAPGPLREAAGFYYQEFSNLRTPLKLKGDPYGAGEENEVSVWAEYLIPEKAKALAHYEHPVFGQYPAITRNSFGRGTFTYEGTCLSDKLQEKVVLEVLKSAGVALQDSGLPAPVKVKHGTLRDGKAVHFYLNFSAQPRELTYAYTDGMEMLSGAPVAKSTKITLPGWDLAIIRER